MAVELTLSEEEKERYDRQMRLPGWGEEAQRQLKGAKVVVVGAGGLGSPCSIYLAVLGWDASLSTTRTRWNFPT